MTKRIIEKDLPLKKISEESVREKSIRHGHISTLHMWWARRPLAASRAAIYASLADESKIQDEILNDLVEWETVKESSYNEKVIKKAARHISDNLGDNPKVADPFAGGGSIPLEAQRLGCETYAYDLNPVALMNLKATLQYPQKYGKPSEQTNLNEIKEDSNYNLLKDFQKWSDWVEKKVEEKISEYYNIDESEENLAGYIWARTTQCERADCGAEIPLLRNFWLTKKGEKVAIEPHKNEEEKKIEFEVIPEEEVDFDANDGTVNRSKVTCPFCGSTISADDMRERGKEGEIGHRAIAKISTRESESGKFYELVDEDEKERIQKAEEKLSEIRQNNPEHIPNEKLPEEIANSATRARHYGFDTFEEFFNTRQLVTNIQFTEVLDDAYEKIKEDYDEGYAEAIKVLLTFAVDKIVDRNNVLCIWNRRGEKIEHPFGQRSISMTWDYVELYPFSNASGNWDKACDWIERVIKNNSVIRNPAEKVEQADAAKLDPDEKFDAVITDPPYYQNIQYSELSDFFYVWQKRMLGDIFPEEFSTPLTPKSDEIVQNRIRHGGTEDSKQFYENKLTESFQNIGNMLKEDGISTIIFAHSSHSAWETMINSLLNSDLVVTASWPIETERKGSFNKQRTATLASSIFFVCRKIEREDEAYFEDIKPDIEQEIEDSLDYFWEAGIKGADFFISAIGPAIKVFGRYNEVKKYSGEEVEISEFLEFVEGYVAEYALDMILEDGSLGNLDAITRFYVIWRWAYDGNSIDFDDARKLAQALGIDLDDRRGDLFEKSKGEIHVLKPNERDLDSLNQDYSDLDIIDAIHLSAYYWQEGEREELSTLLDDSGFKDDDHFWRVVQALSQITDEGDSEKRMLQGLTAAKDSLPDIEGSEEDKNLEDFGDNQ